MAKFYKVKAIVFLGPRPIGKTTMINACLVLLYYLLINQKLSIWLSAILEQNNQNLIQSKNVEK